MVDNESFSTPLYLLYPNPEIMWFLVRVLDLRRRFYLLIQNLNLI